MEEQRDKPRLLDLMNTGYTEFTTLIAPLNAAQLTTPGVDHQWSIKDILVHLAFWQHHLLTYLQSAIEGKPPEKMTHETIDALRKQYPGAEAALAESEPQSAPTDDYSDMNDYIYLRNKSRQLDEVQTDFHASYAQVVATVRSMDEALLFDPAKISWGEGNPLYAWVVGNTFGHYEEHIGPIKNWLASQA
ncbi:MAG TPA: ClbS/DfsB family four-helix bundle protein, partial [Ktedonobacteraceae bacterium]|nr:ClbS/DfsB family four-helix bundle protein [Ktedonobacteraceae bacterium]